MKGWLKRSQAISQAGCIDHISWPVLCDGSCDEGHRQSHEGGRGGSDEGHEGDEGQGSQQDCPWLASLRFGAPRHKGEDRRRLDQGFLDEELARQDRVQVPLCAGQEDDAARFQEVLRSCQDGAQSVGHCWVLCCEWQDAAGKSAVCQGQGDPWQVRRADPSWHLVDAFGGKECRMISAWLSSAPMWVYHHMGSRWLEPRRCTQRAPQRSQCTSV